MTFWCNLVVMDPTSHPKMYVSLALQALQEASEEVARLESALDEARRSRDELIGSMSDISVSRLARITGLSRQSIYKISPGRIKD